MGISTSHLKYGSAKPERSVNFHFYQYIYILQTQNNMSVWTQSSKLVQSLKQSFHPS